MRVGVLGAGTWAQAAHLPASPATPAASWWPLPTPPQGLAESVARSFGIAHVCDSPEALIGRNDLDLVDVCTPSHTHLALSWAALEAGHHVLCEKPVAFDFRDTRRAAELARAKGLKTKLGFTFRYAPAMRYFTSSSPMASSAHRSSSWLRAELAMAQPNESAAPGRSDLDPRCCTSLARGLRRPIIDISHLMVGADLTQVVARCATSFPTAWTRHRKDAADEY